MRGTTLNYMDKDFVLETPRLILRKIVASDYDRICLILQDIDVMYAWEHAFTKQEVDDWLTECMMRYKRDGFSYWAVIQKESNLLMGVSGVLTEKTSDDNQTHIGIGYIFNKDFWHNGYAVECAAACAEYAFDVLKVKEVTAQIRPNNLSSIKVAEKIGMTVKREFVKQYKGKEMPHLLYSLTKTQKTP